MNVNKGGKFLVSIECALIEFEFFDIDAALASTQAVYDQQLSQKRQKTAKPVYTRLHFVVFSTVHEVIELIKASCNLDIMLTNLSSHIYSSLTSTQRRDCNLNYRGSAFVTSLECKFRCKF